jgi:hypothetical protein
VARAACPRTKRGWIDAMFAELDEVDERGRASWTRGAVAITGWAIGLRAGAVPASIWWGMAIAVHAVVLFAIGSRSDVEALLMDDDVFLRFAWGSGALLVGLGVLAITWIYSHTDTTPRHRH